MLADNSLNDRKKFLIRVLGLFGLVLLIYIGTAFIDSLGFHVVATNPSLNAVSTEAPFLEVNFNEPLKNSGYSVTGTPGLISAIQISGKTLNLTLNETELNKTYTVTIQHIVSTTGKVLQNKTFRFVPQSILAADLPSDQQQAILERQDHYSGAQTDPILAHLPYSTLQYYLTPSFVAGPTGAQKLVIIARLTLDAVDESTAATEQAAVSQDESAVQAWISSLGLNPANYEVTYQY